MSNDDEQLADAVRNSAPTIARAPEFDGIFARAEAQHRWQRRRGYLYAVGAVAAFATVVAAVLNPALEKMPLPESLEVTGLLDTTAWAAPSDVLLPEREFDIFTSLPEPMQSTNLTEGALL